MEHTRHNKIVHISKTLRSLSTEQEEASRRQQLKDEKRVSNLANSLNKKYFIEAISYADGPVRYKVYYKFLWFRIYEHEYVWGDIVGKKEFETLSDAKNCITLRIQKHLRRIPIKKCFIRAEVSFK